MSDPTPFERARRRLAGAGATPNASPFERARQRAVTPTEEPPTWGQRLSRGIDMATADNPIARAGRTMLADVVATVPRVASMMAEPGRARDELQGAANAIETWGAPRDALSTGAKLLTGVGKYMALGPVAGMAVGSAEAAADPRFSQTSLVAELEKIQRPGLAGDAARAVGRGASWLNQTPVGRAVGDAVIGEVGSRVLTSTARGLAMAGGAAERTAARALDRLNPIPDDVLVAATRDGLPPSGRITPERADEFARELVQPPQAMPTHPRLKRLGPGTFSMPADARDLSGGADAWRQAWRWEQADRPVAPPSPPLLSPEEVMPDVGRRLLPSSTGAAWPMGAGGETLGQARARLDAELAANPVRQALVARGERAAAEAPRTSAEVLQDMDARELGTDDLFRLQGSRMPSGGRRPVDRVRTDDLVAELADLEPKRLDAEQRAQYAWVDDGEDLHYTGSVVPSAKRGADGVSRQAKALQNLEDYQRIADEVLAELKARGIDEADVWDRVRAVSVARDGGAAAAEKARNASLRARIAGESAGEAAGGADPVALAEREARTGAEPDYQVGDGEGFDMFSVGSTPALRRALADHPIASTLTGAAVGASADEEDRLRGAALGAAGGYAAHRLARGDAAIGLTTKRLEDAAEREPRLSALHNVTAEKLRGADRLNGFPAPSVAVVPRGQAFQDFGDITLVGRRALGDPATSHVYSGDVYSARAPRPSYPKVAAADIRPLERQLQAAAPKDTGTLYELFEALRRGEVDRAEDVVSRSDGARRLFLASHGREFPADAESWALRKAVQDVGDDAFYAFARDLVEPFRRDPYLEVRGRRVPYTLETATEAATRGAVRGREEALVHGPGAAKARSTKRFDDLEAMRAAATERIRPPADVEAARVEPYNDPFTQAMLAFNDALSGERRLSTWDAMDAIHRAIGKSYTPAGGVSPERLRRALAAEGWHGVPAELVAQGAERATAIRDNPVKYFEGKPQRAVPFEDFAGAVIPKDASPETRALLERRGIPFREYTDATDREAVREAFMDELQQGGADVRFSVGSTPAFIAAAKRVAQSPVASAAVGGIAGASVDRDNPTRGALVGAALGAGGSLLVRRAAQAGAPLRLTGDADVDAVLGTIARGERQAPKADRMLTAAQQAYTKILDQLYPLRKFGRDIGGSSKLSDVATQASGWRSSANQFARETLTPILEATQGRREEVMALAKAQRALALLDAGLEKTDIPRDVLERTVAKLSADPDVANGASQLQAYYRQLLEYKRANGVITQEAFDAIVDRGDFYTPFVREFEDAATAPPTAGGGRFVNRGTGVRRMDAERASAKTVDPFEQAVLDTFETHRTVAKQRVSNVLAETVDANDLAAHPFLRRVENQQAGRQGRVVAANVNGERRYYEVVDEDLYNAWASFDPQQQNILVTLAAPFKRALQAGVTLLPDFAAANALRDNVMVALQYPLKSKAALGGAAAGAAIGAATSDDPMTGALQGAGLGLGVGGLMPNVLRSLSAMRSIVTDEKVYRQWLKDGGGGFGGMYPRDPASARKLLQELERSGVSASDIVNPKRWVDALHYIGSVAEQAPRFAAYQDVLAKGGDAAAAVAKSADISLDFGKIGTHTKGIAATTAFWNAKVQGWDKLARLLKNPKTWAQGAAMITAPSIALWSVNKDNPDYWERPQWERNLFWLVPKQGDAGGFYRIPKPFEVGYLFASIPERILDYAHEKDPEALAVAMRDMLSTAADGTVPLLPTAAQPIVENLANYSFFRNRPIVSRPDLAPERQFDSGTSSLAVGLGKATGTSPQQIDNLVSGYAGGAGKVVRDVTDRVARAAGWDDRPLPPDRATIPVLGDLGKRFTTRDNGASDAESLFWSRWQRADEAYRTVADMAKDGESPEAIRQFVRSRADDLRGYDALSETRQQLLEVRKAQRAVLADRAMSDEKKQKVQGRLRALALQLAAGTARGDTTLATQP